MSQTHRPAKIQQSSPIMGQQQNPSGGQNIAQQQQPQQNVPQFSVPMNRSHSASGKIGMGQMKSPVPSPTNGPTSPFMYQSQGSPVSPLNNQFQPASSQFAPSPQQQQSLPSPQGGGQGQQGGRNQQNRSFNPQTTSAAARSMLPPTQYQNLRAQLQAPVNNLRQKQQIQQLNSREIRRPQNNPIVIPISEEFQAQSQQQVFVLNGRPTNMANQVGNNGQGQNNVFFNNGGQQTRFISQQSQDIYHRQNSVQNNNCQNQNQMVSAVVVSSGSNNFMHNSRSSGVPLNGQFRHRQIGHQPSMGDPLDEISKQDIDLFSHMNSNENFNSLNHSPQFDDFSSNDLNIDLLLSETEMSSFN
jgi:hypothetical protein